MYTNSLGGLRSTLYKSDTKKLHPHAVTTSCMVTLWLVNNPDTIEGMGHSRHIHAAGDKHYSTMFNYLTFKYNAY